MCHDDLANGMIHELHLSLSVLRRPTPGMAVAACSAVLKALEHASLCLGWI